MIFGQLGSTTWHKGQFPIAANGAEVIAYCWAEIEGYSKFESYTHNGSTDGPFGVLQIGTAWVMVKSSSTAVQIGEYDSS